MDLKLEVNSRTGLLRIIPLHLFEKLEALKAELETLEKWKNEGDRITRRSRLERVVQANQALGVETPSIIQEEYNELQKKFNRSYTVRSDIQDIQVLLSTWKHGPFSRSTL